MTVAISPTTFDCLPPPRFGDVLLGQKQLERHLVAHRIAVGNKLSASKGQNMTLERL